MLTNFEKWRNADVTLEQTDDVQKTVGWWKKFDDKILVNLIDIALAESPDRRMAQARILEARGLRTTSFSSLFPQIGLSAQTGRSDAGSIEGNFYDAGFDAAYEIDIFGVNRNTYTAANKAVLALEEQYRDISLTLASEIARSYIEMRGFQKQTEISESNLKIQQETLALVKQLFEAGEVARLDLERAEAAVNTTRAAIPEFQRQFENSKLALSALVGKMPAEISAMIQGPALVPIIKDEPVLLSPATILQNRPDIKAAAHDLSRKTDLSDAAVADIFPKFTLSGFFGITKTAILSSTNVWNMAAGSAVALLDFGRIKGQIDAAKAREQEAFEMYRKTVLEAVAEVESALNDYAKLSVRKAALIEAYKNAEQSFILSESLYKEGETSFLDLLIAQRELNDAEISVTQAEALQSQSLVRIYKSMGFAP